MLGELRAHGSISIAGIVGQRAQRAGAAFRSWKEHVVGSRNGEDVRDRAAVTTTRLAESERSPGPCAVGVTPAEAPVTTSHARSTGDLKGHEDSLADAALADLLPDGDHLGHRLVPHGKRPGEETERCHRVVEVTARDGERTHERSARVR